MRPAEVPASHLHAINTFLWMKGLGLLAPVPMSSLVVTLVLWSFVTHSLL